MFRKALEAYTRVLGAVDPYIGLAMFGMACVLERSGRLAEAAQLFSSAGKLYSRAYGPEHAETKEALGRAIA